MTFGGDRLNHGYLSTITVTTESIQITSQPVERKGDRVSYRGFLWVSVLPTSYVLHHSFSNNILLTKPDYCTLSDVRRKQDLGKDLIFVKIVSSLGDITISLSSYPTRQMFGNKLPVPPKTS